MQEKVLEELAKPFDPEDISPGSPVLTTGKPRPIC